MNNVKALIFYITSILVISLVFYIKIYSKDYTSKEIQYYTEIPGITLQEINAIAELKRKNVRFSYGSLLSTEIFVLEDKYVGFTPLFCELLSKLFGIKFVFETYEWDILYNKVQNCTIDFTGDISPTNKLQREFHMTSTISNRELVVLYNKEGSIKIGNVSDLNNLKIGILENTLIDQHVREVYQKLNFETVEVSDNNEALKRLLNKDIDVIITEDVELLFFDNYPNLAKVYCFPLVTTPISLSTANPELEPIISAINKYIASKGANVVNDLYKIGMRKYLTYKLMQVLTDEEKEYIKYKNTNNIKIPIALEAENYPICF